MEDENRTKREKVLIEITNQIICYRARLEETINNAVSVFNKKSRKRMILFKVWIIALALVIGYLSHLGFDWIFVKCCEETVKGSEIKMIALYMLPFGISFVSFFYFDDRTQEYLEKQRNKVVIDAIISENPSYPFGGEDIYRYFYFLRPILTHINEIDELWKKYGKENGYGSSTGD